VVERKDVAGWLDGPGRAGSRPGEPGAYAGERLGLPESGPGSVARFGRRLAAVAIDWIACVLIARAFSSHPALPLGVFAVENLVLLASLGSTFGMRLLGLRVVSLREPGHLPAAWRALVRTVLLCLVIPAFIWDRDGRGLHDKAAGTVVVRAR
jgi:uncharacterized RDD family membrane protein YckC